MFIVTDSATLTGKDWVSESMDIFESICSKQNLKFGCCESSVFRLRVISSTLLLMNKKIKPYNVIDGENIYIGEYTVISDKPTADRRYRDITAYDSMYDIIKADVTTWYNTVLPNQDSTLTLKQFRDSFFQHLGIEQEDVTLVNDEMTVTKTVEPSQISGQTVITAICEINGCFGHISNEGKFKYVHLEPITDDTANNIDAIITANYEDFETEKITKLQIRQEENDIGYIYGTGNNCYVVQDNFLVYGKSSNELSTIAKNMYSVISKVAYTPAHVEAKGNPTLSVGDSIKVVTRNRTIYTYILQRTLKGIQALRDTYDAEGEQYQSEKVNSIHESIIQLKGKTNVLKRTIEELSVTITDKEQGLSSRIEQNASNISTEITRAKDAENVLNTKIGQTDEKISVEVSRLQKEIDGDIKTYNIPYVPTLYNYPAWDFTYNIPCNNTVKLADELEFEYTEEYYSKNARTIAFNEITFVSYRFMKDEESGKWHWREVADSEYGYVLQQISMLQIEADNISSTVQENKTYSDGQFENLSSKITQQAKEISAKVSQQGGNASSFAWVLTASGFELVSGNKTVFKCNSGGVSIDGYTTTKELNAVSGRVGSLEADHVSVSSLNAVSARVNSLEADHVSVASLNAVSAKVANLEADHVSVASLNAVSAKVANLEADHVSVASFNAMNATVKGKLTTSELSATISDLSIVVVKMLQIGNKRVGSTQMNGHTVLTWE